MSSGNDVTVTKFNIKGRPIYVKITWNNTENNLFQINVFDNDSCWSGCFSFDMVEKYRNGVEEEAEDYYKNVKLCLIKNSTMYDYDFSNTIGDSNSAIFTWKKKFKGTTAVLTHGAVPVILEHGGEGKNYLIDLLMNENMLLKQHIQNSKDEIKNLKLEIENYRTELKNYVNIKTSLESDLYGKFVSLLNTKKRRIKLLEDYLGKLEKTT